MADVTPNRNSRDREGHHQRRILIGVDSGRRDIPNVRHNSSTCGKSSRHGLHHVAHSSAKPSIVGQFLDVIDDDFLRGNLRLV